MKTALLLLTSSLLLSSCNRSSLEVRHSALIESQPEPKKLLRVIVGGKKGFIDRTGNIIINPQYDSAEDFKEGLSLVCVGPCDEDHWRGYRYKGTETETLEQTFKYGYINETGKIAINPMFEQAEVFSEGMAGVCVGHGCYHSRSDSPKEEGKWGYIDKTGTMVIPPQFSFAAYFHEGLAPVSVGDKWGFIDKAGKFVINPQFDFAGQLRTVWLKSSSMYQQVTKRPTSTVI